MSLIVNSGVFTIDDQPICASFELTPGQVKGIYGPSGSGKSTLFHLLAGLAETNFDTGNCLIDGKNMVDLTPKDRIPFVSLMFQNPDTQFCMETPREELLFCLENRAVPVSKMALMVHDALAFCGILHLANQALTTLSGGEKQLVALACCVVLESKYLLLDEPFANLDQATIDFLLTKLKILQKNKQVGILLIDHRLDLVNTWIHEWLVLQDNFHVVSTEELLKQENRLRATLPHRSKSTKKGSPLLYFDHFQLPIRDYAINLPNYTFYAGEMIGISGKSGLGKSTFFRAILQQEKYAGKIYFKDHLLTKHAAFSKMSWIMQNPQDQFIEASVARELANGNHAPVTTNKLSKLGLLTKRDLSPFLLSQGQQRRLAVACLLERPIPILLVDEPTYGQDLRNAWQLMTLLSEKAATGTLILIVSHDDRLLNDFCDYTLNFNQFVKETANEKTESNRKVRHHFGAGLARFFSK